MYFSGTGSHNFHIMWKMKIWHLYTMCGRAHRCLVRSQSSWSWRIWPGIWQRFAVSRVPKRSRRGHKTDQRHEIHNFWPEVSIKPEMSCKRVTCYTNKTAFCNSSPCAYQRRCNSGYKVAKANKFAGFSWTDVTRAVSPSMEKDRPYKQCLVPVEHVLWK